MLVASGMALRQAEDRRTKRKTNRNSMQTTRRTVIQTDTILEGQNGQRHRGNRTNRDKKETDRDRRRVERDRDKQTDKQNGEADSSS